MTRTARIDWSRVPWLFLVAYTCSGAAGLVYEVTWTRLLTLHLGHTTAAASTVVGAFLLGLAAGAAIVGRAAQRMPRVRALRLYAGLELAVATVALLLPVLLGRLTPLLRWAYDDGEGGLTFPLVRVTIAVVLVLLPAVALGATFPLAIRWFASESALRTRRAAMLYAANTLGAAAGALAAGFVLIPRLGVTWSIAGGVAASVVSAGLAWLAGRRDAPLGVGTDTDATLRPHPGHGRGTASPAPRIPALDLAGDAGGASRRLWLAAAVLALSGFAALLHEIAWTRILALSIGPTTYAFAAALAAVIAGSAAGSWLGTAVLGRVRQPALWLALTLAAAAITASYTCSLAGRDVALHVATELARGGPAEGWAATGAWISAALVVPTALCLGVAFPLAIAMAGVSRHDVSGRVGVIYAANTVGAVSGSLAAGFVVIPWTGLQVTLQLACACLIVAALAVAAVALDTRGRLAAAAGAALAVATLALSPPWDRALMTSGAYLYAPFVPPGLDLGAMLTAGHLNYYDEGAAATIAVKTLTGTTTLTVDGKTDASNRGDMLTQALVAHVPLLLHDAPRQVAVVGLGSGVTVGAALTHPVSRVDVVELSPEVVEASRFFERENRHALADPRTRLLVGDGRTHLRLGTSQYDVIVSEPSNPWIAGVAALFTREFFAEARARLTPGGVFCQWANAYNIGDADLRAIAATFLAEFPDATALLVGEHDVLFVGTTPRAGTDKERDDRWTQLASHWARDAAAADLRRYGALTPFAVLSLVVAGPAELAKYSQARPLLDDDRMPLEFSAPREIHRQSGVANGATLRALLASGGGPPAVRAVRAAATAADWRDRGLMLARSDVHTRAYDDFVTALTGDPDDAATLDGFVRSATLLRRAGDALTALATASGTRPLTGPRLLARSKLLAASGSPGDALTAAREAARLDPTRPEPLEQVASLIADTGDHAALRTAVGTLARAFPDHAATAFYRAVEALLGGDAAAAVQHAERAIAIDPAYAAVYDLAGAALTRLERPGPARAMFERSLSFDAHDSTAYTNLGVLALEAGRTDEARSRFAEALWLNADDATARAGLAQALAR